MKYLITGGAGFIGSNLVDELVDKGNEVVVIDNLSTGNIDNINPKVKHFINADITRSSCFEEIKRVMGKDWNTDAVFHLAALPRIQPSIVDPKPSNEANITGTLNVIMYCLEIGAHLVYSSSSSIYGDQDEVPIHENAPKRPKSPYALQKLVGEQYIDLYRKLKGLSATCLRYFNVYGERQLTEGAYATVLGIFLQQNVIGTPLTIVGDGSQRRDFTYVKDVVRANILAAEIRPNTSINIGRGKNYSVLEIAKMIEPQGAFKMLPSRPGESKETLADNSRAKHLLGWTPEWDLPDWLKMIQTAVEVHKVRGWAIP